MRPRNSGSFLNQQPVHLYRITFKKMHRSLLGGLPRCVETTLRTDFLANGFKLDFSVELQQEQTHTGRRRPFMSMTIRFFLKGHVDSFLKVVLYT